MNEVVIHDAVPMDYLCLDMQSRFYSNDFLPDFPVENEVQPNMSLSPSYHVDETEEKSRYKSSSQFFKWMAGLSQNLHK
jgi:hypothetical protein